MATTRDLIYAAKRGDRKGVLTCLQRGADIEGTNEGSQTALSLAISNNHTDVAITLLEKGANPNWRPTLTSSTLLIRVINIDLTNVASCLIDKGARVNDCNVGGYTALMVASKRGHKDLAIKLIKHGAQVNARDNQKYTSLHWASIYNHPAVLRVLLANGADINAVNELGETALDIAKEKHYSEIENIIKAHGQDIGTFTEMRQLIAALQSRVVGMEESRRVNDERLAGRIHELKNEKNVMKTKIENLLEQNSIKDRQLTELKTLLVGMGESRRVNDERLVGRIKELENGKNVMETKIENLLEQNSIKDRQLTELKTLLVGMGESRRVNDERLVGRINELENGKNVMETKIKNILKQNSTKDRQLTELKTRVEGIDESRRKNDESLVGRLDELQSEKSVMESKIENLLWQNSVKDRQLTELKTQVEQKLIQNNQTELETRLENLRVELDEMKRENRLKVEQLDQLKNATEALAANGITQSPKSSFSRVLSENSTSSSDIAEKRSDSKNLTEKVRILETKLNDSEQDKMVDTIEISGIEERPSENLNIVLFAVARALDLPFPTDLVLVSRQPAFVPEVGKRPRVILVKFKKAETARNWLKAFKDKRPTGIVASELDASFKGDKIFVNQKLTSFNKKLLRRVKEFAKGKEYQYVWVQDGKILLRKNRDSPIMRIKTNNDIPSD